MVLAKRAAMLTGRFAAACVARLAAARLPMLRAIHHAFEGIAMSASRQPRPSKMLAASRALAVFTAAGLLLTPVTSPDPSSADGEATSAAPTSASIPSAVASAPVAPAPAVATATETVSKTADDFAAVNRDDAVDQATTGSQDPAKPASHNAPPADVTVAQTESAAPGASAPSAPTTSTLPMSAPMAANTEIDGTVIDASTGLPLSGASVSVAGGIMTAISGRDGKFSFRGLMPGSYQLVLAREGYQPAQSALIAIQPQQAASITLAMQVAPTGQPLHIIGTTSSNASASLQRSSIIYRDLSTETLAENGIYRAADALR